MCGNIMNHFAHMRHQAECNNRMFLGSYGCMRCALRAMCRTGASKFGSFGTISCTSVVRIAVILSELVFTFQNSGRPYSRRSNFFCARVSPPVAFNAFEPNSRVLPGRTSVSILVCPFVSRNARTIDAQHAKFSRTHTTIVDIVLKIANKFERYQKRWTAAIYNFVRSALMKQPKQKRRTTSNGFYAFVA